MSEGPTEQPKHRHKRGLDVPPHKVAQLRWAARRIPWLVVGAVVGALCMQTWPGQTKEASLREMTKWVGGGLAAGLMVEFLARRWLFPKTSD